MTSPFLSILFAIVAFVLTLWAGAAVHSVRMGSVTLVILFCAACIFGAAVHFIFHDGKHAGKMAALKRFEQGLK